MANLIIQENGVARTRPAINGEELTVRTPCDCSAVTGVQINGVAFPFYDAAGNSLSGIPNLFAKGSLIRVLIDTENTRAFILNTAAPSKHEHTKSEITDFPASMPPTAHNQAASTITAGTFAGQVVANGSGQTPGTSLLRNSKLVSADTNPTVNGEICWTYK